MLLEAKRLLRPGGRIVVTMIGEWTGRIGHKIWWYSEDKHREVDDGELMGMSVDHVMGLLRDAAYVDVTHSKFLYRLNHLFVGTKP